MKNIVELKGISKSFGKNDLLKSIDISLREGEYLSILGPGGSGKSTLLKIIVGIVQPDDGLVQILGETLNKVDFKHKRKLLSRIGVAFQQGALFDFLTVHENILFAMENMTEFSLIEMEERVSKMLEAVNLPRAAFKLPSELSGGMRRRVGICRALCTDPELALLDEPTAGLDPVTSTIVIELIHRLAEQSKSSLVCMTSNVEVAFRFSKRVAILKDGVIIGTGTWEELHALNDPWVTKFLDVRGFNPTERGRTPEPVAPQSAS